MMLQATTNSLIIKVDHKYIGNISSVMKLASIQNNASVDPNDLVNIMGEVISIPKKIDSIREYDGFTTKGIVVGDTAIFSYSVISDIIMDEDKLIHKNNFQYHGKDYFLCDITKIFAVIRNGEIIMLNGYVIGTPLEESTIVLPASMKRQKKAAHSTLMQINVPRGNIKKVKAKIGDTFYVNPFTVQKYQINGKRFIISEQDKIFGIKK